MPFRENSKKLPLHINLGSLNHQLNKNYRTKKTYLQTAN